MITSTKPSSLPLMESDFHEKQHMAAIYLFHAQCSTLLRLHDAAPGHEKHFRMDTGAGELEFFSCSHLANFV